MCSCSYHPDILTCVSSVVLLNVHTWINVCCFSSFFDAWVILCVLQKTLSKFEHVCKQVKCVKRLEKRLCFENCMNVLGNWARWISYSVLTIEKNCNLKGLLLQQKKEPIRRQKACSRLCTTGYSSHCMMDRRQEITHCMTLL